MKRKFFIPIFIFLITLSINVPIALAQDVETGTDNSNKLAAFTITTFNLNPAAGEAFKVVVIAGDENGNRMTGYKGEGFMISGGMQAPDGSEPEYEVEGEGWIEGVIRYSVRLYKAGGPVRVVVEDEGVRGESKEIEVRAGREYRIEIQAGDGQSGPVGKDVTEAGGQDLEVIVYDEWRNPVDGVEVRFGNETNGSWFDTDEGIDGRQVTKVTSGGGIADCDEWVLGARYGVNRIDAWIGSGIVRKVTFKTVENPVTVFEVGVKYRRLVAGETFTVTVTAKEKHGTRVVNYTGEGFKISGGSAATDGSEPEYEVEREGWIEGVIVYRVRLHKAEGPVRVVAEDGGVRGESEEIEVRAGREYRIEIQAGDGQSGPVGKDVTEAGGQDLEVIVYDEWRNPVDGVEVRFGNETNGSWFDTDEGIDGRQVTKVTSGGGIADCDEWVLGERYGANSIDAWIGNGKVKKVTFVSDSFWTAKYNTGLIFNFDFAPIDFESYQGGIGGKYYITDKIAYRGLISFQHSGNTNSTTLKFGNSVEYHFLRSRISPYAGAVFDLGYLKVRSEVDADNWSEEIIVPVSFGPIFGIEFMIFDYLSIFIEYKLTLVITNNTSRVSVVGSVTEDKSGDVSVGSGLGNDAKIGIIFYINRFGKTGKIF